MATKYDAPFISRRDSDDVIHIDKRKWGKFKTGKKTRGSPKTKFFEGRGKEERHAELIAEIIVENDIPPECEGILLREKEKISKGWQIISKKSEKEKTHGRHQSPKEGSVKWLYVILSPEEIYEVNNQKLSGRITEKMLSKIKIAISNLEK